VIRVEKNYNTRVQTLTKEKNTNLLINY
jgi:hypothetical protein